MLVRCLFWGTFFVAQHKQKNFQKRFRSLLSLFLGRWERQKAAFFRDVKLCHAAKKKKSEREKLMIWYIKDTGSTVTFLFSVRCAERISWEEVKKWTNRKGRKLQSTNETQAADTRGGTTKERNNAGIC